MHSTKPHLVVFDFDGTITSKDSLVEFIRFVKGSGAVTWSYIRFFFTLVLTKMGWTDAGEAKEKYLGYHFSDLSQEEMEEWGNRFGEEIIPGIVRKGAAERIQWHRDRGDELVIVSASLETWISGWGNANGFTVIGTRPAFQQGRFSGFSSPNCKGNQKVIRLTELFDPNKYRSLTVYGDTSGDHALMGIADNWFYRPFR